MRLYFFLPLVILIACNNGQKPGASACTSSVKTELYFGLKVDSSTVVTNEQFSAFIHKHLVNAGMGLTILDSEGRWLNTETGLMDAEKGKLVIMVYNGCDTSAANAIGRAVKAYNSTFLQQSVLRVDYPVSYQFIEER